jgi:hypothetical protein
MTPVTDGWLSRVFVMGSKLSPSQVVTGGFVLLLVCILVQHQNDRWDWAARLDRIDERNRFHTETQMKEHWEIAAELQRVSTVLDRLLTTVLERLLGVERELKKDRVQGAGVKTQSTITTAGPGTAPAPVASRPMH